MKGFIALGIFGALSVGAVAVLGPSMPSLETACCALAMQAAPAAAETTTSQSALPTAGPTLAECCISTETASAAQVASRLEASPASGIRPTDSTNHENRCNLGRGRGWESMRSGKT